MWNRFQIIFWLQWNESSKSLLDNNLHGYSIIQNLQIDSQWIIENPNFVEVFFLCYEIWSSIFIRGRMEMRENCFWRRVDTSCSEGNYLLDTLICFFNWFPVNYFCGPVWWLNEPLNRFPPPFMFVFGGYGFNRGIFCW